MSWLPSGLGLSIILCVFTVGALYLYNVRDEPQKSPGVVKCFEERETSDSRIAVIIPTLHEAAVLPRTIAHLFSTIAADERTTSAPMVIVVDAGHGEDTRSNLEPLLAAHPSLSLVSYPSKPSRGGQLNFGAAHAATADPAPSILLFLHADTLLPSAWDSAIRKVFQAPRPPVLGTFTLSLPPPITLSMRIMLWGAEQRAKRGGLPYGDQAYFMRRRVFDALGGFPPVPIMEDLGLLRRMKRYGTVMVIDDAVQTSPRRWKQKGVLWNTVLNQLLITAWLCGASHERIYTWYYGRPSSSKAVQ